MNNGSGDVKSHEWAMFGLAQNLCTLTMALCLWFVSIKVFGGGARVTLEHLAGAVVGVQLVLIYVRLRVIRGTWQQNSKTN